jgi:hypothetical protein
MNAKERGQAGDAKRILAELEELYPVEVADPDALPNINVNTVVKLMKEDRGIDEIAHEVRCPVDKFRRWWAVNLPLINAQLRKI